MVEAVIDTGSTSDLTLPNEVIKALDLPLFDEAKMRLADGSVAVLRRFEATIEWAGKERDVLVVEAETAPLLGTPLLRGFRLRLDWEDEGTVILEPLR